MAVNNAFEQDIKSLVKKYTEHFSWRPRYEKWVNDRIWQENNQDVTIKFLKDFVPDLKSKKILK